MDFTHGGVLSLIDVYINHLRMKSDERVLR